VIPEVNVQVGYLLRDHLRLTLGYTFLDLSHAVRPGNQIDTVVDGRFLDRNFTPPGTPPTERPARKFDSETVWLQGINLGLEWNY
jgi:hypothetical protein